MKLGKSRPEQKLGPSPDSTTARRPLAERSSSSAASSDRNISGSSALCLSARVRRTSATPSEVSTVTRSGLILMPACAGR